MVNELPNGVMESSNEDEHFFGGFAYASSVRQTYKVADRNALDTLSDMETGDMAYRADDGGYYFYTGTTWQIFYTTRAVSFTPIWNGFSPGNGTLEYARYTRIGGQVNVELSFSMGSTSSFSGGSPEFAVPAGLPLPQAAAFETIGTSWMKQVPSTGYGFNGAVAYNSGRLRIEGFSLQTSGGLQWVVNEGLNAGRPFTWQAGSRFTMKANWQAG